MPVSIPMSQVANQIFDVTLDGQTCTIGLFSKGGHLYMNIAVDDETIMSMGLCVGMNSVLQFNTAKFSGCFLFIDTLGKSAPYWQELGTRFRLYYYTAAEMENWSEDFYSYVK